MGSISSKSHVKLLFLDVDGVLNSMDSCRQNTEIQDNKLLLLKKIIDATDAKIVVSSSWRLIDTELKQLSDALNRFGMDYIGCTPKLFYRTDEIKSFLLSYSKKNNITVTNWIAIDDTNLIKWNTKLMKRHFVKTSLMHGLTKFDAENAIQLLNK
eukprot:301382_1